MLRGPWLRLGTGAGGQSNGLGPQPPPLPWTRVSLGGSPLCEVLNPLMT